MSELGEFLSAPFFAMADLALDGPLRFLAVLSALVGVVALLMLAR